MTVPFTFYEIKQSEEVCPLSPLSQAFNDSPVFSQDEDSVKLDLIEQTKPGTYIIGQSRFGKRVREELKEESDPMEPPKLQRQNAIKITRVDYNIEDLKKLQEEDRYIPMPGNKDYDKKPSYHRKNVSPFGNYIFNYVFDRKAPNTEDFEQQREYRQQMLNDMDSIRRLLYDYETHINFLGCREERLKHYRELDQLLHFNQLETLPQPTGDEICMNPPPSPHANDCFYSSSDKCDNILHDHNSK